MLPFMIPRSRKSALNIVRMVVCRGGGRRGQGAGNLECTDDESEKHAERAQVAVVEHVLDKSRQNETLLGRPCDNRKGPGK